MFYVGQTVKRVIGPPKCDHPAVPPRHHKGARLPELGQTYTVKTIREWPRCTLITLCECDNSHIQQSMGLSLEPGFDIRHFAAATDIAVFTELLKQEPARTPELCGND